MKREVQPSQRFIFVSLSHDKLEVYVSKSAMFSENWDVGDISISSSSSTMNMTLEQTTVLITLLSAAHLELKDLEKKFPSGSICNEDEAWSYK